MEQWLTFDNIFKVLQFLVVSVFGAWYYQYRADKEKLRLELEKKKEKEEIAKQDAEKELAAYREKIQAQFEALKLAIKLEMDIKVAALKVDILAASLLASNAVTGPEMTKEIGASSVSDKEKSSRMAIDISKVESLIGGLTEKVAELFALMDAIPARVRDLEQASLRRENQHTSEETS